MSNLLFKEPFTLKTAISIMLACAIISVQLFFK
jgi:hypothetical protein